MQKAHHSAKTDAWSTDTNVGLVIEEHEHLVVFAQLGHANGACVLFCGGDRICAHVDDRVAGETLFKITNNY